MQILHPRHQPRRQILLNGQQNVQKVQSIDKSLFFGHEFLNLDHALVKLRHRHDKLIQSTDSLTKHYIITTTNIIFQMQKQINKLKRKTSLLEQKLARQAQLSQPIIRIPRLTKG